MIAERRWSVRVEGLICKEQKVLRQQGYFLLTHSKKPKQPQIPEFRTRTMILKAIYPLTFGGEEEDDDVTVAIRLWL